MRQKALVLLTVLFWTACKLDNGSMEPMSNSPYFSVQYTANNGSEHVVTAGLDSVYLFTSYAIGDDTVVICTSTFNQVQCLGDTCAGRLAFEFRNTQSGQQVVPEFVFRSGEYRFKINNPAVGPTVYRTTFYADTTFGYTNFSWLFQDQYSAQGSTTTFDFSTNSESIPVELRATRNNRPSSRVRRLVSLLGSSEEFANVNILISPQPTKYRIAAISSGGPIVGLSWNNGTALPVFEDSLLQPTYQVNALGTVDSSNNIATAQLEGVEPDPGIVLGTINFSYNTTVITLPIDRLQLGTVAIQWTDEAGKIWRSDQGAQETNGTFKVLENLPYEINEQGQKTWQMQVAFTCYLYDQVGQRINFSGQGLIAVAYP